MGKGLRVWTQEEPEVAGKRIWNLLGSQAPLLPIFSIPEPYTATPFVAWELRVLISRRPGECWGSEQSPGSLRLLHEKTSWEGQKHWDRCMGGERNRPGVPTSVPGLGTLCPSQELKLLSPSHLVWVSLPHLLPPLKVLIPVTSTEAPVMYPLSSDAKNATTSATSTEMRGRVPLIPGFLSSLPSVPRLCATLRDTTTLGISSLGTASPLGAHPLGSPCVPSGSFRSPVRKHSCG